MITIEAKSFIEMIKDHKKVRKVLIIGSGGVGKTSILNALTKHHYVTQNTSYIRTPFINFGAITITNTYDEKVRIQFHDLAGQLGLPIHALKDFSRYTLGATDIIFLVFSSDNLQSFFDLQKWSRLISEGLSALKIQPSFILIRNKTDLISRIDQNLVAEYLKMNPLIRHYFEINCVTRTGLDEINNYLNTEVV